MRKTNEDKIKEQANLLISNLFGFGDEKQVITHSKQTNQFFVGGIAIDDSRVANLRSEAEFFLASDMWKIINETLRDVACKVMFEKSTSFDDMKNGKSILYTLSFQNNTLNLLKNYKPKRNN